MTQKKVACIGLMGAPGSGKSLVAGQLASQGCVVIDSDALSRQAFEQPGVIEQLKQWWGDAVIQPDGRVDRSAVARVVFQDQAALDRLEGLIHPIVHAQRARLRERALASPGIVALVEDSPLLIESGIDKSCDVLIYIDAPLAVRQARVLKTRGWGADELARREENQLPLDIKRERADYVISNDAGEAHCLEQTRRVLSRITSSHPVDPEAG